MGIEFNIDFDRFEGNGAWVQFLAEFGARWTEEAQRLAQVRIKNPDSTYARKFIVKLLPGNPPKLQVGNYSDHAIYVEEDTVAHDIGPIVPKPLGRRSFTNPSRPGALRWFDPPGGGKGAAVFASRVEKVHIPAHKGYHIIEEAVRATGEQL